MPGGLPSNRTVEYPKTDGTKWRKRKVVSWDPRGGAVQRVAKDGTLFQAETVAAVKRIISMVTAVNNVMFFGM